MKYLRLSLLIGSAALLGGCAGRAEIFPNSEPALRHTAAEFAADAAKRFPYKADAPRGGVAAARPRSATPSTSSKSKTLAKMTGTTSKSGSTRATSFICPR